MQHCYMFPAQLRDEQGKTMSVGLAYSLNELGRVVFESDFVPLLKMGERVQIVRVVQGIDTHCLEGEVFVSSVNMLHITSVTEQILDGARRSMSVDAEIRATLSQIRPGEPLRRFEGCIYSLSLDRIHFTCTEELAEGDIFALSLEEPIGLEGVVLEIYRRLLFGKDSASYQCRIVEITDTSYQNLSDYITHQLLLSSSLLGGTRSWSVVPQDSSRGSAPARPSRGPSREV